MRNLLLLTCLFYGIKLSAKVNQDFNIDSSTRTIFKFQENKEKSITEQLPLYETLASGDKIKLGFIIQHGGLYVATWHKENMGENLIEIYDSEFSVPPNIVVYEHDFDSDGNFEIVIVYSSDLMSQSIKVYRYAMGMSKLVGNFNSQEGIRIKGNKLIAEFYRFDEQYLFEDGIFYSLQIHDPKSE